MRMPTKSKANHRRTNLETTNASKQTDKYGKQSTNPRRKQNQGTTNYKITTKTTNKGINKPRYKNTWGSLQQAEIQNGKWKCKIQECTQECTNQAILTRRIRKVHTATFTKDPKQTHTNVHSANKNRKTCKNYWNTWKSYNQEEQKYDNKKKTKHRNKKLHTTQTNKEKEKENQDKRETNKKARTQIQQISQDREEPEIHLMAKAQQKKETEIRYTVNGDQIIRYKKKYKLQWAKTT